jgi:hypothetical protein
VQTQSFLLVNVGAHATGNPSARADFGLGKVQQLWFRLKQAQSHPE